MKIVEKTTLLENAIEEKTNQLFTERIHFYYKIFEEKITKELNSIQRIVFDDFGDERIDVNAVDNFIYGMCGYVCNVDPLKENIRVPEQVKKAIRNKIINEIIEGKSK